MFHENNDEREEMIMKTTTSDAVRKDQLHAAMEQLETAVREMFESGRFHEYLTMLSRFHNYSFNNILLAWCQNHNISRLASYQTWKKQKMQVRKGEKAIKILCPIPYKYHAERNRTNEDGEIEKEIITINGVRFRLGNVFDISQCDGELDSIVKVPTDNSEELHRAVQQLMDSEDQIMYDPDLTGSSANGFFSPVTGEIHIKEGMSDLQTFRCILHEQAHSLLHGEDDAKELERGIKEIEAEAASYLCCSALGFPQTICYSTGYLAGWSESRTTRELLQSVSRIEKCARGILDWVTSLTDLKVVDC